MLACTVWLTSLRPDPTGPRRLPLPPFCDHRHIYLCTSMHQYIIPPDDKYSNERVHHHIIPHSRLLRAPSSRGPPPTRACRSPDRSPPAPHAPHATPISSSALPSIHMAPYFPHVIFSVALRPFPRLSPPLSVLAPCLAPGPHRATVVTTTTVTVVTVVTVAPAAAEDPAMIVTRTKAPSVDGAPAPVLIPISPSR